MSQKTLFNKNVYCSLISSVILMSATGCKDLSVGNTPLRPNPESPLDRHWSERLIVLKSIDISGDQKEKDSSFAKRLCIDKLKGSISQEEFESRYANKPVRLISGPPMEINITTQIDERRMTTEQYIEKVFIPSYSNGVAMNDGEYVLVPRQREVVKGNLRQIYIRCLFFEYHF